MENRKPTRGERNNNPLNIKISRSKWVGKIKEGKKDPVFEEFDTLVNGLRAALKLIRNYIKSGHNTAPKIIRRWCPDETQDAYVNYVLTVLRKEVPNFEDNEPIRWYDHELIFWLVRAMAWQESAMLIEPPLFYEAWQLLDAANKWNREQKKTEEANNLVQKEQEIAK